MSQLGSLSLALVSDPLNVLFASSADWLGDDIILSDEVFVFLSLKDSFNELTDSKVTGNTLDLHHTLIKLHLTVLVECLSHP